MSYTAIPITERTNKIKEEYLKMPVPQDACSYIDEGKKYKKFCTGDRWMTLGYLRGWLAHQDADTTRLRTSYAEAQELYEAQPVITEHELLVGHLYLPEYTPEEQAEYDKLYEMFQMSSHTNLCRMPRKDHLSLNFDTLVQYGINGLKKQIHDNLAALDLNDPDVYPDYEVVKKYEFYQCCLIELDAVLDSAARYAAKALEMAAVACEPRKSELLQIAEIMQKVPANPPETFYEAIQSVQFFLSSLFGLYPINRPDRYLYPFYKADREKGLITQELAQELVDNFCLHISTRVFSRAACGFIVGGQDADGNLVENDLTYMFLTALDHLQLPDPNGALAVNTQTSDEILSYSADILAKGTTHPAFYNDDVISDSLEKNYGCSREDAVNYIHTTCAEISVAGKTRGHTTHIFIDMPRILFETVKDHPACGNLQELEALFLEGVKNFVKKHTLPYFLRMLEASRIGNEPMRVCTLVDNCIARGKSIFEGGEKYTFLQPIMIGFATTVDSFIALKELVFDSGKYTLQAFAEIVEKNFEDNEALRQHIIYKLPHYGNDNEKVDTYAADLAAKALALFKANDTLGGKLLMPGTFSYDSHAYIGSQMGATFDGRPAHAAYSDGCCPVQGRDVNGPTSMIKSLTSWEQSELLGGMVVNIKFGADVLKGPKKEIFLQLLRTFLERGGIEMQVNVVDRKTLEDARIHPENHQNLLVRIGGYSDYFVRQIPSIQEEIINRTEY